MKILLSTIFALVLTSTAYGSSVPSPSAAGKTGHILLNAIQAYQVSFDEGVIDTNSCVTEHEVTTCNVSMAKMVIAVPGQAGRIHKFSKVTYFAKYNIHRYEGKDCKIAGYNKSLNCYFTNSDNNGSSLMFTNPEVQNGAFLSQSARINLTTIIFDK